MDMFEETEDLAYDISSELQNKLDELQDAFDSIPESLQNGPAAEIIQARIESLEEAISELDALEVPQQEDYDEDIEDHLDENGNPVLTDEEEEEYQCALNAYYTECFGLIDNISE